MKGIVEILNEAGITVRHPHYRRMLSQLEEYVQWKVNKISSNGVLPEVKVGKTKNLKTNTK